MKRCKAPECDNRLPKLKDSNRLEQNGFCSDDCLIAHWKANREDYRQKATRAREKADRQRKRETRTRKQELDKNDRRRQLRLTQQAFNEYIRTRDHGRPCHSCGAEQTEKFGGTTDCSHYRSVGAAPHLRFNVFNAVSACVKCNREYSGNIVELRKGLISRFGLERVERIESDNEPRKFTIEYLERLRAILKRKTKSIKARRQPVARRQNAQINRLHHAIGVAGD